MADFSSLIINIPEKEPFKYDKLNREAAARMMMNIFTKFEKGAVVSIDSPWGTGKTTFIKMLGCLLRNNKFKTIYFNAWESDYSDDPLCALLSQIAKNKEISVSLSANLGKILIAGTKEIAKGLLKKFSGTDCNALSVAIGKPRRG